jgi:hypothetical protein
MFWTLETPFKTGFTVFTFISGIVGKFLGLKPYKKETSFVGAFVWWLSKSALNPPTQLFRDPARQLYSGSVTVAG